MSELKNILKRIEDSNSGLVEKRKGFIEINSLSKEDAIIYRTLISENYNVASFGPSSDFDFFGIKEDSYALHINPNPKNISSLKRLPIFSLYFGGFQNA